jgi:hypothetical protein
MDRKPLLIEPDERLQRLGHAGLRIGDAPVTDAACRPGQFRGAANFAPGRGSDPNSSDECTALPSTKLIQWQVGRRQ